MNERLKKANEFTQYLIPSYIIRTIDSFYSFLHAFQKLVIKPIDGRKGKGIYYIEKREEEFYVLQDSSLIRYQLQEMEEFLNETILKETFILQPYIECKTQSGQIYDFRLHTQKDGEGRWGITAIYPRLAPDGSIVANINNGGSTNYLRPFLMQEFQDQAFNIKRTLEYFALSLSSHLDDLQMYLYEEVIDELGIDIALDKENKIWIFEVNWRPGCPPTFYLEMDVVKKTIEYAKFLVTSQPKIKQHITSAKNRLASQKPSIPIIAITGSAGKTTTKAFIASILQTRWKTFSSKDYWNTTEHTKKHAEQLRQELYQAAVLEYGMAYKGVITEHCSIIQPNISVVTNIGLAHVGNFNSEVKNVAKAKSELIHGMKQDGVLFMNNDDENSRFLEIDRFKGKIYTVGIKKKADYRAHDVQYEEEGMSFKTILNEKEYKLFIPIFGEHHVYNALHAIAVADYLGFSPVEIISGLQFKKPPRRLTIYHCNKDITLIDDTVHSHPQGVKAAIDVLVNIAYERKIVILGQMRELGDLRDQEYRKVGQYVAEMKLDLLITYGFRTDMIGIGAKEANYPSTKIFHFKNKGQMHSFLEKELGNGDTVLVKGASKTNMFETIKFLDETFS
ncbi:YheC/YheD family protein [Bacillus carboniphilus]|uniref:YheC/YheD family protein n=1 Tax=Bacillus carboniphilus TaxID=86663 RepID=A0ABY9JX96_9BACI|nr:YheC/YheD family protein [Bacillus carboniphilus]WLR43127.1 YheC/YheD family protein [Bacillus carboniphilus]